MNLGVQYYRAPFPEEKYWEEDFRKIRESGLNTVQLWVLWSWVESTPGTFNFDDYDRLMELARKYRLNVILSTIAEIQPHWIHREIPDSEMIDCMGRKVVSSLRGECNFGLTPGGCTDHPEVHRRMMNFIRETGKHFLQAENLTAWDIWNELRWNVNADELVCFCDHTITAWHKWLEQRYGSLNALNSAWKRRYSCWEEVRPGKLPDRPYTESMAWQNFLTVRSNLHAAARYTAMRSVDPHRPITAHGASPSALCGGSRQNYPIERGNDWAIAEKLDGVGCSSFPQWFGIDDADFGIRIEMVKSAANGKLVWLSELQGGRAAIGFNVYGAVHAVQQQRWIWNGIACGADSILFWCWRDEVFGRESAGFGLNGRDGLAEERLAAMKITGTILESNEELLKHYKLEDSEIGILFSPQSYYLAWAQEGTAERHVSALMGYARALVRSSIPYRIVEEKHLDEINRLKLLILPHLLVLDSEQEKCLLDYVKNGGHLLCESECGAFSPEGFYRQPDERFLAQTGIIEQGRRPLESESIQFHSGTEKYTLTPEQWVTPLQTTDNTPFQLFARYEGNILAAEYPYGKGSIFYMGSYFGKAYKTTPNVEFEHFLRHITARTGAEPAVEVLHPQPEQNTFLYLRGGSSNGKYILFVFFPPDTAEAVLRFRGTLFSGGCCRDLISGAVFPLAGSGDTKTVRITPNQFRIAILTE